MDGVIIVRGKLSDPSHIALDGPVFGISGSVEVAVRPAQTMPLGSPLGILQALRDLPDLDDGDVDELERMIQNGKLL